MFFRARMLAALDCRPEGSAGYYSDLIVGALGTA
jgi:hypothetical protein